MDPMGYKLDFTCRFSWPLATQKKTAPQAATRDVQDQHMKPPIQVHSGSGRNRVHSILSFQVTKLPKESTTVFEFDLAKLNPAQESLWNSRLLTN